jgi:DNA-binding SARP family transcriptional activator
VTRGRAGNMAVTIRLLGGFGVEVDRVPVPAEAWSRRQAAALVKLLAVSPQRTLHREQVIDALWPDLGLDEAAPRLHKAAHYARRAIGTPSSVVLRGEAASLCPDEEVWVDAFAFDEAAHDALAKGSATAAEEALALHGGQLLPHDLYEPWTEALRERLSLRHLQLLRQAERWEDLLALDPADEDAHLALMRAHVATGDRRTALAQYERMARTLERELGVEPGPAARALRDELLAGETLPEPLPEPLPVTPVSAAAGTGTSSDGAGNEPAGAFVARHGPGPDGGPWPFVGRGADLERVAGWYLDGERGGVVLLGGAGLGKTRLAEECLRAATSAGLPTARIAGHPEGRDVLLSGLARLLPADIVSASGAGVELDRSALFPRARSAITSAVPAGQRLLLVVDDVDHLDDLSRSIVLSLVVDHAVFAVLTLRLEPDAGGGLGLDPGLEHLVKDGHLECLRLTELDAETVETLLHRILEGPMRRDDLRRLTDVSLGNPGVLRQLVETARESGTLVRAHGVWQLTGPLEATPTLEGLVARRLAGLDGEARHALELMAVAGELSLDVLVDLTSEAALEELERRGVLEVRAGGRRTDVALAHPLHGEVTARRLPALAARRLRRELADAVEARGALRTDDRVRVVSWRLEGGGDVDRDLLVDAARLALADRRLDVAARILDRLEGGDESLETVQLRAELAFRQGEPDRVEALLATVDLPAFDDAKRAQVVRRRATNLFYATTDHTQAESLLVESIAQLADPDARCALEATLAMTLANGGQVGRAVDLAEAALPDAAGAVRLELLRVLALTLSFAGRSRDAVERAQEGLALRTGLGADVALPGRTMLLYSEIVARTEDGRLDEARRIAEHARRQHHSGTVGWLDTAQSRLELLAGRPRSARRLVEPRLNEARAQQRGATERWALALHARGWLLEGESARAAAELERVAELERDGTRALMHFDIDRAHAWLDAACGRSGEARARLVDAADDARDRGAPGIEAILLHDLVRFGLADGHLDRTLEVHEGLQGDLARARLLHARGVGDADPVALDAAAALFTEAGADLFAAEAAAGAERAHRAAGNPTAAEVAARLSHDLRTRSGVRLVTPALR